MEDNELKQLQDTLSLRGDLSWMDSPEQEEMTRFADNCKGKIKVFNVARQTGKTYWTAKRVIQNCLKYDKHVAFYVSAYYEDLRKYIHPTLDKIIQRLPRSIRPQRVGSDYKFKNGSIMYVAGVDKNPNAGRGNTIDTYAADEGGFIKVLEYLVKSVALPATRKSKNPELLFPSTPPQSPEHYFRTLALKAEKEDRYFFMDITMTSATQAQIDEYREECDDETTFEREYMCRFVTDDTKAVVPGFGKVRNKVLGDYDRPTFINQHTAGDHGHKDQTGLVFGYWDFEAQKIVIEDCVSLIRPLTSQIAEAIIKTEYKLFKNHCEYRPIDSTPQVVADLCSSYNCVVNKVNLTTKMKDIMLRLRQLIDNDMFRMVDTPGNRIGANQIEFALWKDPLLKKTFERSNIYGHFDVLAAIGYFINTIDMTTNPRPNTHGLNPYEQIIVEVPDYNKDTGLDAVGAGFFHLDGDDDTELI